MLATAAPWNPFSAPRAPVRRKPFLAAAWLRSMLRPLAAAALLLLAGCLSADPSGSRGSSAGLADVPPFLGYAVPDPDMSVGLLESDFVLPGADGVTIHVRIVRPDTEEKVPVVVEFTPYTAGVGSPGQNPIVDSLLEPAIPNNLGNFDTQFARRGYAFAYGDVRGTGDSTGCLDLRGKGDVADAAQLIEWLGTQPWSNGKVGFIGASYPGSEAHIAAIAEAGAKTGHLGAVIPVVASTSFYHYHHNDGVPYNGNHALGGTNTGYTQNAVAPTLNAQHTPNYLVKSVTEATCPHKENVVDHGGFDQTGEYYGWWQERNIRAEAANVRVPVLMAQGLGDWNVKPDHIATYFNDLTTQKTLIAGQWAHQYPRSQSTACETYDASAACDPNIPWGSWWAYANAFFDTYLKGIDTGMFTGDVAWVQDNSGTWHRSNEWPLRDGAESMLFHFQPGAGGAPGGLTGLPYSGVATTTEWYACPNDQLNRGTAASAAEEPLVGCTDQPVQSLVFETPPFAQDTILSGVGLVNLTLTSSAATTHLTVVIDRIEDRAVVQARENYGYLNPTYRVGLTQPKDIPAGQPYTVTIDLYPQEDFVKAGQALRLTLASDDAGRTIEAYEPGTNGLVFGPDVDNTLWLPTRPAALQGVRL